MLVSGCRYSMKMSFAPPLGFRAWGRSAVPNRFRVCVGPEKTPAIQSVEWRLGRMRERSSLVPMTQGCERPEKDRFRCVGLQQVPCAQPESPEGRQKDSKFPLTQRKTSLAGGASTGRLALEFRTACAIFPLSKRLDCAALK